jgi:phosphopantothenoylcysteine decarboxylase / phosphopantothenate---cysteine ligase
MRVLITAGGTREAIDAARVIANTSTGRLGAHIAEAAAASGHEVLVLAGFHAVRPAGVRCVGFDSSADLARLLREHVPAADAVVHAAAVSDYVPVRAHGKLPSDAPELVLRLKRAPKLIDGLRALQPAALLVGFKLTAGQSEARQVELAEELRRRASLDLVVVNDAETTGEADHEALFVAGGGVCARGRGKADIARRLVAWLDARRAAPGGGAAPAHRPTLASGGA